MARKLPAVSILGALIATSSAHAVVPDGNLYFANETGGPATLVVDHREPVPTPHGQALVYPISDGDHDLQLIAEGQTIDLHLRFLADKVAQDRNGRTCWCVISGRASAAPKGDGRIHVMQLDAPACSKLLALGSGPPAR